MRHWSQSWTQIGVFNRFPIFSSDTRDIGQSEVTVGHLILLFSSYHRDCERHWFPCTSEPSASCSANVRSPRSLLITNYTTEELLRFVNKCSHAATLGLKRRPATKRSQIKGSIAKYSHDVPSMPVEHVHQHTCKLKSTQCMESLYRAAFMACSANIHPEKICPDKPKQAYAFTFPLRFVQTSLSSFQECMDQRKQVNW